MQQWRRWFYRTAAKPREQHTSRLRSLTSSSLCMEFGMLTTGAGPWKVDQCTTLPSTTQSPFEFIPAIQALGTQSSLLQRVSFTCQRSQAANRRLTQTTAEPTEGLHDRTHS